MKIPENHQYVLFGGTFVLANKLQLAADKRMQGLSTKQWFLLRNLQDLPADPPPTITLLARETDTSRQNVSKMLDVLQREGYVMLHSSEKDRRSQSVEITEKGKQRLKQTEGEADSFFSDFFSGISRAESEAAAKVVIKLIDNLDKMQDGI